jgi:hypothetical protein
VAADLDPRDLAELRRRVVDPVVGCLIRSEELERVDVGVHDGMVTVDVVARGELLSAYLGETGEPGPWDAEARAEHLYETLTNDLPTTGFAWGEERTCRYVVPGPVSRR